LLSHAASTVKGPGRGILHVTTDYTNFAPSARSTEGL
jgi:hypothetical protein